MPGGAENLCDSSVAQVSPQESGLSSSSTCKSSSYGPKTWCVVAAPQSVAPKSVEAGPNSAETRPIVLDTGPHKWSSSGQVRPSEVGPSPVDSGQTFGELGPSQIRQLGGSRSVEIEPALTKFGPTSGQHGPSLAELGRNLAEFCRCLADLGPSFVRLPARARGGGRRGGGRAVQRDGALERRRQHPHAPRLPGGGRGAEARRGACGGDAAPEQDGRAARHGLLPGPARKRGARAARRALRPIFRSGRAVRVGGFLWASGGHGREARIDTHVGVFSGTLPIRRASGAPFIDLSSGEAGVPGDAEPQLHIVACWYERAIAATDFDEDR